MTHADIASSIDPMSADCGLRQVFPDFTDLAGQPFNKHLQSHGGDAAFEAKQQRN